MMRRAVAVFAAVALAATNARAQGVAVEVLATGESFKTDTGSRLLALNDGRPVFRGQMYGWVAYQPSGSLRVLALGELYGVTGDDHELEGELQAISIRWWHSRALRLEGGKILLPIGEFAARRFSDVNPLIGTPDTYVDAYPWGATVSGAAGPVDYVVGVVTLPAVNTRYTPEPSARLRPVIGAGFSAGPRLRFGLGATHGTYLGSDVSSQLPAGASWQGYTQTVITADARYSVGRFDTRAEAAWSSYHVPTMSNAVRGLGWYVEGRAALSPRFFAAARYEDNRYPFVMPVSPSFWVGTATTQMNGEIGLGYRPTARSVVKASIRRDHWPVHEAGGVSFPDGYAVAVQAALHVDLLELLRPKP